MRLFLLVLLLASTLPTLAHAQQLEAVIDHLFGMEAECGHVCAPARRHDEEDHSRYVRDSKDLLRYEQLLEGVSERLDVSMEALIALGAHETHWFPPAVSPGGHCGVFQQSPVYAHPRVLRGTMSHEEYCDLLMDPDWAVKALESKLSSVGIYPGWPAEYNSGREALQAWPECAPEDDPGYLCTHHMWRRMVSSVWERVAQSD